MNGWETEDANFTSDQSPTKREKSMTSKDPRKPHRKPRFVELFVFSYVVIILVVLVGGLSISAIIVETKTLSAETGIVAIEFQHGHGSGVIVAHQGNWWYVATAAHVVPRTTLTSMTINGCDAFFVAEAVDADVALVRLRDADTHYEVYELTDPKRGMVATARGWLHNEPTDKLFRADFQIRVVCERFDNSVAFQGGAYWGMSGSGIFNEDGKVIGILSRAAFSPWGEPWAGLSLFESSEHVRILLDENL